MEVRRNRPFVSVALIVIAALVLIAGTWVTQRDDVQHFDVVVVGAGPGGIGAAIQAASMGSTVAIVEETDWLGGQMTAAGVGTIDGGALVDRWHGVYAEFARATTRYYQTRRKSTHTCFGEVSSLCVDPKVGQLILRRMIAARPLITVMLRTRVVAVNRSENTVTGVRLDNGRRIDSAVVIDASDFGDVLPLAGADYRLANGTSARPPAPNACISDFAFTAVLRKYPDAVPAALRVDKAPPGYTPELEAEFARLVRHQGHDLKRAEFPLSFTSFIGATGLPDVANSRPYDPRSDGGALISRSVVDLPNNVAADASFVESPAIRVASICRAKLLTIQFVYYIQHALGETHWSLADDEGYDYSFDSGGHRCELLAGFEDIERYLPLEPYVRESRRLVGVETLTGRDVRRDPARSIRAREFGDSIAVGHSAVDMRGCADPRDLEPGLDRPDDLAADGTGAFEVPIGTLIPVHVDGLLAVEKNISVSRVAESAIRDPSIAFSVGQAAGALAALAHKGHVAPRAVSADNVRAALVAAHAQIDEAGQ